MLTAHWLCDLFQRRGVQDILAVEVTPSMIEAVRENFPSSSPTAGNALQVRTWLGDVQSIPAYQVRSALPLVPPASATLHLVSALSSHA